METVAIENNTSIITKEKIQQLIYIIRDKQVMLEGKNLVVFVAEGLSDIAIREDVTPNLYRLYKEGFQFENFYTPLFPVSTADGEYITDTSLSYDEITKKTPEKSLLAKKKIDAILVD